MQYIDDNGDPHDLLLTDQRSHMIPKGKAKDRLELLAQTMADYTRFGPDIFTDYLTLAYQIGYHEASMRASEEAHRRETR